MSCVGFNEPTDNLKKQKIFTCNECELQKSNPKRPIIIKETPIHGLYAIQHLPKNFNQYDTNMKHNNSNNNANTTTTTTSNNNIATNNNNNNTTTNINNNNNNTNNHNHNHITGSNGYFLAPIQPNNNKFAAPLVSPLSTITTPILNSSTTSEPSPTSSSTSSTTPTTTTTLSSSLNSQRQIQNIQQQLQQRHQRQQQELYKHQQYRSPIYSLIYSQQGRPFLPQSGLPQIYVPPISHLHLPSPVQLASSIQPQAPNLFLPPCPKYSVPTFSNPSVS